MTTHFYTVDVGLHDAYAYTIRYQLSAELPTKFVAWYDGRIRALGRVCMFVRDFVCPSNDFPTKCLLIEIVGMPVHRDLI